MFHKVLVLQEDEEPLTSSVGAMVPFKLAREARTNGMHNKVPKSKSVIVELRFHSESQLLSDLP
jgi:hypothetical protein